MTAANEHQAAKKTRPFLPAKPSPALIYLAQRIVQSQLALSNRVHVDEEELDHIRSLPAGAGVMLTPNHADEMDPCICMELSRRTGRQFVFMCNREAFDEYAGLARFALQMLGLFSVERGAHDQAARQYSLDVLKQGKNVLVVFPEGEIFYLNQVVQPFHSGAIDLCMQSIIDRRRESATFTTFVVPLSIKYMYAESIDHILDARVKELEKHLRLPEEQQPMEIRLRRVLAALVDREAKMHHVQHIRSEDVRLTQRVQAVEHSILVHLEDKYHDQSAAQRATIDGSWELGARLREMLAEGQGDKEEIRRDLSSLHEVAQMVSWQPRYFTSKPCADRFAEALIKLERELYRIRRPKQLAKRNVFLRISKPIDLGGFVEQYQADAHSMRHTLTTNLQQLIQEMLDSTPASTAKIQS